MYRYHGGPRRIFWFFLGGLAATLWLKGKDRERRPVEWSNESLRTRWDSKKRGSEPELATERETEREKIAAMGSQAVDTVADVSEAALDTIIHTVEALKARLSDRRNIRQRPEEEPKTSTESHRV